MSLSLAPVSITLSWVYESPIHSNSIPNHRATTMAPPLHEALSHLRPKLFDEIPTDNLSSYLRTTFHNAEIIANSVPPALHYSFLPSTIPESKSSSSQDPSSTLPTFENEEYKGLWSHWGKPLKIAQKDNPLNIPVYKMAGHDRHGAWFARRSLHRGLAFERWKGCMKREFEESMAVEGGPGEGAVRGIAADRRVEERIVEGEGKLDVFQLSAVFPGPVAPREFVIMTVTGESVCKDEESASHYVVVSIPVEHPDAPPRDRLVRGYYESVEMIREVKIPAEKSRPGSKSKSSTDLLDMGEPRRSRSTSRPRGTTISYAESRGPYAKGEKIDLADVEDGESAVEWIMITRSDPGGGIPRFMVERNTPASITQDAVKFLKWALKQEEEALEEEEMEKQGVPEEERERRRSVAREKSIAEEEEYNPIEANGHLAGILPRSEGGILSSLTNAAEAAIENYAPNIVREQLEPWLPHHRLRTDAEVDEDEESTETSSLGSFESAQQFNTAEDFRHPLADSSSSTPMAESLASLQIKDSSESHPEDDRHYKELAKLEKRRKELEKKFEQQREREAKKSEELNRKETKEAEKARDRHEREIKKQREKHEKEVKRLEEKREKEAKRQIERLKKQADKDEFTKVKRERDEFKQQVDVLKVENELLRKQLGELQRENTALVREMGKVEGGGNALRLVREEIKGSRDRASSAGSKGSRKSKESKASKETSESASSRETQESGQTEVPMAE